MVAQVSAAHLVLLQVAQVDSVAKVDLAAAELVVLVAKAQADLVDVVGLVDLVVCLVLPQVVQVDSAAKVDSVALE